MPPSATSTWRIPSSRLRRHACSPCSTTGSCWTWAGRETAQQSANWPVASENLLHGQAIIAELISSLKTDAWDGADGLLGLYNYAFTALVNANIQRDPALTREAIELLEPLRGGLARGRRRCSRAGPGRRRCASRPPRRASQQRALGTPSPEQVAGASALGNQTDVETGFGGAGIQHSESTLTTPTGTALAAWNAILDVLEMAVGAAERTLKDPLGPLSAAPQAAVAPLPENRWQPPVPPGPLPAEARRRALALSAAQERVAEEARGSPARRREAAAGGRLRSRRRGSFRCCVPRRERLTAPRLHSPEDARKTPGEKTCKKTFTFSANARLTSADNH